MKITYIEKLFRPETLQVINSANEIIEEYQADGLNLTLRQLYYQFVARGLIKNEQAEYKRIGSIVNDARLAGKMDWSAIEDRTRNLIRNSHWTNPGEIIRAASRGFRLDHWDGQLHYIEVWIEKEALIGVIQKICEGLDVNYFACKGYVSQSEMWSASQRILDQYDNGRNTIIVHLGDHDPSGIDMTRDVLDRLNLFVKQEIYDGIIVKRIALNMDQILQYNPPSNPAKLSDSRSKDYISKHGNESWELDALEPRVLRDLIENTVSFYRDNNIYQVVLDKEKDYLGILKNVEDNWETL
uniref:Uncharacterized protein n=1 Tax=viral metagenome TaxID=1070528 RepID=A0A6M3J0V0_9ZZZZ